MSCFRWSQLCFTRPEKSYRPSYQRRTCSCAAAASSASRASAAARACSTSCASRSRSAKRSSGTPDWRAAEKLARAPHHKVAPGDLEAVAGLVDDLQSLARGLRQRLVDTAGCSSSAALRGRHARATGAAARARSARRARSPSASRSPHRRPTSMTVVATSTSIDARCELLHHSGLVGAGGNWPCSRPMRSSGSSCGDARVRLGGRGCLDGITLLDQRTHPVRLPSGRHVRTDTGDHLIAATGRDQFRHDGPPAGRQLVDHRDVEVGEVAHRQRARNRRGRQHQHVRLPGRRPIRAMPVAARPRSDAAHRRSPVRAGRSSPPPGSARACRSTSCAVTARDVSPAPRAWLRRQAGRRARSCATPSGASHCAMRPKCCSASSSVGAISAACQPDSIARAAASAATTVLPLPTSPCTSRCIGCSRARSASISCQTRCCAARQRERQRRQQARRQARRRATPARAASAARPAPGAARSAAPPVRRTSADARPGRCGRRARPHPRPAADGAGARAPPDAVGSRLHRSRSESRSRSRQFDVAQRARDAPAQPPLRHAGGRRINGCQRVRQRLALHAHVRTRGCTISMPASPPRAAPNARMRWPTASCFSCDG